MAKAIKPKDANQFAKNLLDRIIEKTESPSFSKKSKNNHSAPKKSSSKSVSKVTKKIAGKK